MAYLLENNDITVTATPSGCTYESKSWGDAEKRFRKNETKLRTFIHPDATVNDEDVKWLQQFFDAENGNSVLTMWLCDCVNNLTTYNSAETPKMFNSFDEFINSLRQAREQSSSYTSSWLLKSLEDLCISFQTNTMTANEIQNRWLKLMAKCMPYFTSSYCIAFFGNELLVFYAVGLGLMAAGSQLSGYNSEALKSIGGKFSEVGEISIVIASTVALKMTDLNFWLATATVHGARATAYYIQQLGQYSGLLPAPATEDTVTPTFKSADLAMVAYPLQQYVDTQKGQWGASLFTGASKRAEFEKTIASLKSLDSQDLDEVLRRQQTAEMLQKLRDTNWLNQTGSKAAMALRLAGLSSMATPSKVPLLTCRPATDVINGCIQTLKDSVELKNGKYFNSWGLRAGAQKNKALQGVITDLERLDGASETALEDAGAIVVALTKSPAYSGETQKHIDGVLKVLGVEDKQLAIIGKNIFQ